MKGLACRKELMRMSSADFIQLLIMKTIRWRESYRILSREELEVRSNMVFWHGSDVIQIPCLILRLGLACSKLASQDRPRFSQAVISQVEYGVLHLVDADNPQIKVLVDCEGLSPLRIPTQMMRSCSSLLLDHFPDHLGCLFVIRLPAVARVIAQTFIQVLKPITRKKLKIEGEMYQKVLYDNLPTLPSIFGGCCTCMKCSKIGMWDMQQPHATGNSRTDNLVNISDYEDSPSPPPSDDIDGCINDNYDQLLRTAIITVLICWVFIALVARIFDLGGGHLPSSCKIGHHLHR